MGHADGASRSGSRASAGAPPTDLVFAATGIRAHEAHPGGPPAPASGPGPPSSSSLEAEALEEEAGTLRERLRETSGELEHLAELSAVSLAEVLGMRGGVESELAALARERRTLETLAELERLVQSLADAGECSDADERKRRVAALLASLASDDAAGAEPLEALASTRDDDERSAHDDLDAEIAAMEAKLAEAKRRHDEVDATRRALEAEAAAIILEDLEEDDEGAEVWGEASEDDD